MAAEPPTDSTAPVTYPVLPPYPELILSAIEAVDDKNGANKSSISKQIEATYGSLPAAHSTLLSHHLNKMKASGQLLIIKNNYVKPDPNAPPRRGRGRPPKPKQDLPEGGTVASSPRPRGRPPKPRDDLPPVSAPKEAAPSVTGRKRGRPPKLGKPATTAPAAAAAGGERRGRGRPPKVKTPTAAPVGA
ncbi:HMG-Y-related protein B-like [Cynara cardunculus var. scolymus]|uniref:AT hook, DNA-binding motif-containing protein n=1 Tax=Cynara cardunculus var. scolymus TaxID=59895 RepID=A0A103XSS4_CYNCS|nr:HMG-Y-related protein B-like [Cynara cardunculus var. scolymus]KVH96210.1 AT hook, DNA-binding motif-containing protein [Cynara cardunculus var. scolymus]